MELGREERLDATSDSTTSIKITAALGLLFGTLALGGMIGWGSSGLAILGVSFAHWSLYLARFELNDPWKSIRNASPETRVALAGLLICYLVGFWGLWLNAQILWSLISGS